MPKALENQSKKKIVALTAISVLSLIISAWILLPKSLDALTSSRHAAPIRTSDTRVQINNGSVSSLLFGTNLSLYDGNDQFLTSSMTRDQLRRIHMNIIRMPVRPSLPNDVEIQAAQAIKSLGAYPVVVLRGAIDNQALADDTRIIDDMNSVFGSNLVFYEYGNEEDLLGVDVNAYTASWNAVVPQLKHLALHGNFIGPVNYHYDHNYLTAFLQHANPRPDQISWHEYTCDVSSPDSYCLSQLDQWTNHINDAHSVMSAVLGQAIPIMITEWNYAPNAHDNDGKINDSNFMTSWTSKALTILATNHIFASMQYACTNSVYALVRSDGSLSAQALTMQSLYSQITSTHLRSQPVVRPFPRSTPTRR